MCQFEFFHTEEKQKTSKTTTSRTTPPVTPTTPDGGKPHFRPQHTRTPSLDVVREEMYSSDVEIQVNETKSTTTRGLDRMDSVPGQTPPTFTTHLQNQEVPVGGTVRMVCHVTGYPRPYVRWYKVSLCLLS